MKSIYDKKMKNKNIKKIIKGLEETEKGLEMTTVGKGKTYETLDDMFKAMDKERTILDYIRMYWNRYFWNYVSEIPLRVKTFIQRGRQGWAVSDTWGFDYYLAKVISEGTKHLSKHAYRDEAWKKKMRIIVQTFETAMKILEDRNRYIPSEEFTWAEYKKAKRFYKEMQKKYKGRYHVLTLREAKRFEKGFDVFRKEFFRLWD